MWHFRQKLGETHCYTHLVMKEKMTGPSTEVTINLLIRVLWCILKQKSYFFTSGGLEWRRQLLPCQVVAFSLSEHS